MSFLFPTGAYTGVGTGQLEVSMKCTKNTSSIDLETDLDQSCFIENVSVVADAVLDIC